MSIWSRSQNKSPSINQFSVPYPPQFVLNVFGTSSGYYNVPDINNASKCQLHVKDRVRGRH